MCKKYIDSNDLLNLNIYDSSNKNYDNYKIARYMTMEKAIDMLKKKEIYFSHIDKFLDKNERKIPDSFYNNFTEQQRRNHRLIDSKTNELYNPYISCWTNFEKDENYALWKIYVPNNDGVCIVADWKKLYEQLDGGSDRKASNELSGKKIFMQEVQYVSGTTEKKDIKPPVFYSSEDNSEMIFYQITGKEIYKISPYRYEEEIRFIAYSLKKADGCKIGVNDFNWIEKIIISPFADENMNEKITKMLSKYELNGKLNCSEINESNNNEK